MVRFFMPVSSWSVYLKDTFPSREMEDNVKDGGREPYKMVYWIKLFSILASFITLSHNFAYTYSKPEDSNTKERGKLKVEIIKDT